MRLGSPKSVGGLVVLLTLATLVADFLLPLGIAAGVLYAAAVLVVSLLHDKRLVRIVAGVATLLVLAGAGVSVAGTAPVWIVVTNRVLSVVVIWTAALVLLRLETVRAREKDARSHIRVLEGLLPICMSCKKIRDGDDHWHSLEPYIAKHSEAVFSHGYCPSCGEQARAELLGEDRASGF